MEEVVKDEEKKANAQNEPKQEKSETAQTKTPNTNTFQRFINRKVELAKRKDTLVIITNGRETRGLVELICAIDLAAERLRNRITISKKDKADEIHNFLMNDYRNAIKQIDEFAQKIAKMGDVEYKTPKTLKNILEDDNI